MNITLHDVTSAIETLKGSGQKPTLNAIRATLGNRGSASTILKFKRLAEQGTAPQVEDSPAGVEHFRQLWSLAIANGRAERDQEITDLQESIDALSSDNERLEAECAGIRTRVADLEKQRDQLITDLAKAQQDVAAAQAAGQQHAATAADALKELHTYQVSSQREAQDLRAEHSAALGALRKERDEAKETAHEHLLRNASLKAELVAARAEATHYATLATAADQRAAKALEQAHALSLACAQAGSGRASKTQQSSHAAKDADAPPSLPGARIAHVTTAKGQQSHRPAKQKP